MRLSLEKKKRLWKFRLVVVISSFLWTFSASGQIVVSEIMYDPNQSSTNEFIEVFNTGTSPIDLQNWKIEGTSSSSLTLKSANEENTAILQPQSFAVIFSTEDNEFYTTIPNNTLILYVGKSLSLNNTGDQIILKTDENVEIANFQYKGSSGKKGLSLEKIKLTENDDILNYSYSLNPDGTPGTRNTVTPFDYDLALTSQEALPVEVQKPLSFKISIENQGLREFNENIKLHIYYDKNGNREPENNEFSSIKPMEILLSENQVSEILLMTDLPERKDTLFFIVVLESSIDQKNQNDTTWVSLLLSVGQGEVIITEIMYDPNESSENEFIEIFNTSSDEIDIQNWKITGTTNSPLVLRNRNELNKAILQPRSYAVIFSSKMNSFYDLTPLNQVLVLYTENDLSLNNAGDEIILETSFGENIAICRYVGESAKKGFSLEKIKLVEDNSASNFAYSLSQNGTPGSRNTVTPFEYDLGITSKMLDIISPDQTHSLKVSIENQGTRSFDETILLNIYYDKNNNRKIETDELFSRQMHKVFLNEKQTSETIFQLILPEREDTLSFICLLESNLDQKKQNDTTFFRFVLGAKPSEIIINEIMYNPIQDPNDFKEDQAEFLELYNQSDDNINVRDWRIQDAPNEKGSYNEIRITNALNDDFMMPSHSYAIITADTAKNPLDSRLFTFYNYLQNQESVKVFFINKQSLNLNNDEDLVKLVDITGRTIDSVYYLDSWHSILFSETKGVSLERRNSLLSSIKKQSWSSSTEKNYGGTPLKKNSVFISENELVVQTELDEKMTFEPNPFSPDGDGFDDVVSISFKVKSASNQARIRIYDKFGRLVKTLADEPVGNQGVFVWDGLRDDGNILPVGIYIVLFELIDANTGNSKVLKKALVLAKKL